MNDIFEILPISKVAWEEITQKKYKNQSIIEAVELYNIANNDSDEEIVQCEYCGAYSKWGDCDVWECEECGKLFCNDCVKVNTENEILCKECKEHDIDQK